MWHTKGRHMKMFRAAQKWKSLPTLNYYDIVEQVTGMAFSIFTSAAETAKL